MNFVLVVCILVCIGRNRPEQRTELAALFQQEIEVTLQGTIYKIVEKEKTTAVYLKNIKIQSILGKNVEAKAYPVKKILSYISQASHFRVGNQIIITGNLQKFQKPSNTGQFNEYEYYRSNGIAYKMYGTQAELCDADYHPVFLILNKVRDKLQNTYYKILSSKEASILSAMLLGEKSMLDEEIKTLYQKNGIAHILVISGLHISILGAFCYAILKRICILPSIAAVLSIVVLFLYGSMTGMGVSTKRAILMLSLAFLAKVIGRTYDMTSAMAFSAVFILLQNPLQLQSSSFLLSFGAVGAIAYLFPVLENLFKKEEIEQELEKKTSLLSIQILSKSVNSLTKHQNLFLKKIGHPLKQSVLLSASISIVTLPMLLYFFYEFSLYSIFLNFLIIPFLSLLFILSILAGVAGCISIKLGIFFAGGVHYILCFYEKSCLFFQRLPYAIVIIGKPSLLQLAVYYSILIFVVLFSKKWGKKVLLFLLLGIFLLFYHPPTRELQVTFLDVGQGDSIFMESESGITYLLDGGSSDVSHVGKYRIEPYLKAKGKANIDYAMITHTDSDHISGIWELLSQEKEAGNIRIKHLVLPDIERRDNVYRELVERAKEKQVEIIYLKQGDKIQDGKLEITCLHPDRGFQGNTTNAYSLVLSLSYGAFDMLLTGDLEGTGEQAVQRSKQLLDYEVLKVAHHGSKNATSTNLLKIIKPEVAIISCGRGNRYGHPHKELLERLKAIECKSYTTIESGAIQIKTDGTHIYIEEYLKR